MVIYSNEIKDFLDKIYFYELTHRNDLDFPLYYYEEKLFNIDKLSRTWIPCWYYTIGTRRVRSMDQVLQ